ncbi:holo-acyl-carrier-protein synthase [Thermincola ferriacetica]|uniref:Holo-[acyl-carrier-protein] synthase n=1 Tax=Thermincola ferriacetica TaxID=281456 RepID=A0A0L6W2P8_9FIRM|nr:holo-acyl-carrier-protein synthase [Thermincola ferriacetica]
MNIQKKAETIAALQGREIPVIIGIGTDIVDNKRLYNILERVGERFLSRVYTPREIELCTNSKGLKVQSLAARFAGKEAVAKALGTGIGPVGWKEIEIVADASGAPTVKLTGKALEQARRQGICQTKISLSHTEEYSVAFVLLTG